MDTRHIAILLIAVLALVAGEAVSADQEPLRPLRAPEGLAPFQYTNAIEVMPNYLAGEKWGTEGRARSRMQLPLEPEESVKRFALQRGFRAKLWAAEPEIVKPIALAWDVRGRLWIAETIDYPNQLQADGEGRDRIKICEDTDADGVADRFTVFADKLSIPTSLCFANGGLLVIENGQTTFLKDTDGDDVADERRVLFEGWGVEDTHATASNLRYGLDNWIWGTVGYSGFQGEVGGEQHRFGQGVFRFKPDGSKLEFMKSSNNNTWGLGLTEGGRVLGSTANNNASWFLGIPNRYYEAVEGWTPGRMETIADSQAIFPITEKIRQVDSHMKYTAGAGHAVYTARTFPKEYWNQIAFVAEPTGHLVGFFRLEQVGAGYRAVNLGSFMASDDEWSAPIVAEVGPDGAVWVLDWYNYIVQHNPTPIGFKTGPGNAYETQLRDKRHGRIYRVIPRWGKPDVRWSLETPGDLVTALKHPNQLWRLHAQRLLVERNGVDVVAGLVDLVRDRKVDSIGMNVGAVHALWTLQGLGAVTGVRGVVESALTHPSPAVRRTAVNVLPGSLKLAEAIRRENLLSDPDASVRLAAYLALAELSPSHANAKAIYDSLKDPLNSSDPWLLGGAIAAAVQNYKTYLPLLQLQSLALPETANEVARRVSFRAALSEPVGIAGMLAAAARTPEPNALAILDGMNAGWPEGRAPSIEQKDLRLYKQAMEALPHQGRDLLLVLARKWGRLDLFSAEVKATSFRLKKMIADPALEDAERVSAARHLLRLQDEAYSAALILNQVKLETAPQLSQGLLRALGESRNPVTGASILRRFPTLTPVQKRAALDTLILRTPWAALLMEELERGGIHPNDLGWRSWQRLRNHSDRTIARRAVAAEGRKPGVSADLEALVKQFLPVAKRAGDSKRGAEVFRQNCAVCHRFYGDGGKVGPDLSGIGARSREDVLTDILDPNRSVEANYALWTLLTRGGESYSGRLDVETQTSVELLDLTGETRLVERKDIEKITASSLSIMPTGFEALGADDLAHLLEFLAGGIER